MFVIYFTIPFMSVTVSFEALETFRKQETVSPGDQMLFCLLVIVTFYSLVRASLNHIKFSDELDKEEAEARKNKLKIIP